MELEFVIKVISGVGENLRKGNRKVYQKKETYDVIQKQFGFQKTLLPIFL